MNLDTLKLFCDVVRLRSISRGAAQSGVTQSAASQAAGRPIAFGFNLTP